MGSTGEEPSILVGVMSTPRRSNSFESDGRENSYLLGCTDLFAPLVVIRINRL